MTVILTIFRRSSKRAIESRAIHCTVGGTVCGTLGGGGGKILVDALRINFCERLIFCRPRAYNQSTLAVIFTNHYTISSILIVYYSVHHL